PDAEKQGPDIERDRRLPRHSNESCPLGGLPLLRFCISAVPFRHWRINCFSIAAASRDRRQGAGASARATSGSIALWAWDDLLWRDHTALERCSLCWHSPAQRTLFSFCVTLFLESRV